MRVSLNGACGALLLLATCLAGAIAAEPRAGVRTRPKQGLQQLFAELRRGALIEAGQQHFELGDWCRKRGLVDLATVQYLRAALVSEGQHADARRTLDDLQNLDHDFWKEQSRRPTRKLLDEYERRERRARETELKQRIELASWAARRPSLADQALVEYSAVLCIIDAPLVLDAGGRVVLPGEKIPEGLSKRIIDDAIVINGQPRVRDEFLKMLPDVDVLHEAASERVRVRTTTDQFQARDLLAMELALLLRLDEDVGGPQSRRIEVLVLQGRQEYEVFLALAGFPEHERAAGVSLNGLAAVIVNGKGRGRGEVQGIVLHETAHLFEMNATHWLMPSWYREGLAESYGGVGTFTWDGETLDVGKLMSRGRLGLLKSDRWRIPVRDLTRSNVVDFMGERPSSANVFYAESWALLRYLNREASVEVRKRFAEWQALCRGVDPAHPDAGQIDRVRADRLRTQARMAANGGGCWFPDAGSEVLAYRRFQSLLGPHLEEIEAGFAVWLQGL